jgi:acyl dehydratase
VETPDTTARWELPEDLGRRYAQASGDFNPIHLHALSARAFGFKRAIAHGMWSAARGLAQLSAHDPAQPMSYRVWFKLPVFLPSSVSYREQRLGNGARFETRDERGEKPHARGLLTLG